VPKPPSDDDDDAKARIAGSVLVMKASIRAEQQARLANAINDVSEVRRAASIDVLREIAAIGIWCEEDKAAVAILAALVHDDASWDAVVQVRQVVEAMRGNKGKS
jgi:ABC-type nitrate/sulfonate/bicarbonate transport system substrate-binding protein